MTPALPRKILGAINFGPKTALAFLARLGGEGVPTLVGQGQAALRGRSAGEVVNVGDVVESVVEAFSQAERSARQREGGSSTRRQFGGSWTRQRAAVVYFNYDDPLMESVYAKSSKELLGDGQIRPSDIDQIKEAAERSVNPFERKIVYAKEIDFVMDERDHVANPLGVCGRKLEVCLHLLLSRSEHYDAWQRVMRRAGIACSVPVVSICSAAYAGVDPQECSERHLVLDWGEDLVSLGAFERGALTHYGVFPAETLGPAQEAERIAEWARQFSKKGAAKKFRVTGDRATDKERIALLQTRTGQSVELGPPRAAGLLRFAAEWEKRRAFLRPAQGFWRTAKDKVAAVLHEYF